MSQLRALFQEIGFTDVETFIASGNVIFTGKTLNPTALESKIEAHLESALGYDVDTFIRPAAHVQSLAVAKLFPQDGQPGITIHVAFLKEKLGAATARKLESI